MGDCDQCFFPGCKNEPQLKCDCSNHQIMCSLHVQKHITENSTLHHDVKIRFVEMPQDWLQKLPRLKLNLLQAKTLSLSKAFSKYNLKIQQIQAQIQQSTIRMQNKTLEVSQKYDKILKSIETLLDSKRIPDNQNAKSIQKLVDLEKQSLKNLSKIVQGKNRKFIFHLRNKTLYRINIKNKNIKSLPLPSLLQNIHSFSTVVDWDQQTIFHFGCPNFTSSYKISKETGDIIKLPDTPGGRARGQGSAVLGKYIFLFGGWKQNPNAETNMCFRFDTEILKWSRIADLPVPSSCNSAVRVGKQILVTGYNVQGVYKYDPETDSFSLLLKLLGNSHRTILKTSKQEIIVITGNQKIYKSKKQDLGKWEKKGQEWINSWNMTDRREYEGKVSYLDFNNILCTLDIYSYKIKQARLRFN